MSYPWKARTSRCNDPLRASGTYSCKSPPKMHMGRPWLSRLGLVADFRVNEGICSASQLFIRLSVTLRSQRIGHDAPNPATCGFVDQGQEDKITCREKQIREKETFCDLLLFNWNCELLSRFRTLIHEACFLL
jgi:hypothetical protein